MVTLEAVDVVGAATPDQPAVAPADAVATRETGETLWSAVAELPPLERAAVVLRYRDGLSYQDAAVVLQREGFDANSANLWQARRRYFEMNGEPVPARPYNNGQPRIPRTNRAT